MRLVSAALRGIGRATAVVARAVPATVRDLIGLSGAAAVVYGIWQIYVPAAWIVGGAMMVLVALRLAHPASQDDR